VFKFKDRSRSGEETLFVHQTGQSDLEVGVKLVESSSTHGSTVLL
jgi:hypothetical protein